MRLFSRILILSCCFLFISPAVAANAAANALGSSRITGNITNIAGNPLCNAIVKIFREAWQGEIVSFAHSDDKGFFKSMNLKPGTYYLQVSRQGYRSFTTSRFVIDPGRTISLDIALQKFIDYVSKEEDPRNWDMDTVMRSTSDRRLVFRNLPAVAAAAEEEGKSPFYRSGAMNIASRTSLGDEGYRTRPKTSQNGVTSTFAYTEPISRHSRMVLSGQLDFGYGSFWRIRDTFNYRPNSDHDYRISVGYGRMNARYLGSGSISSEFIAEKSGLPESGIRTLAFGIECSTRFLDLLSVKYGFDYSRLHYGSAKNFFYPSVQVLLTPSDNWAVQTTFTSRRISDENTVVLPDGEVLDLAEPTLITMVGDKVSMSQVRHSEMAVRRTIASDTAVEVAVFQDHTKGPGLPVMITTITPLESKSRLIEMNRDHSRQRGVRITVGRKIWNRLSGSVDYVYGKAFDLSTVNQPISIECPDADFINYIQKHPQHSITGRLDAIMPFTKTNVLATVRWNSGNPLAPVDWFSDRIEIGTRSTNLEIRQIVPVSEFLGTMGRWEVLVDLRNLWNQGMESFPTPDGEIVLNRNPRSLRFGLNLSFR
jgi:hypothetical protein